MATDRDLILRRAAETKYQIPLLNSVASGVAIEPNCHDRLEICFDVRREIITEISYSLTETACLTVFACINVLCELVVGKSVLEAYLVTNEQIAEHLSDDGMLDKEHVHCAMMAELALKRAIMQYSAKKKEQLAM